jgi:hypothetical protein
MGAVDFGTREGRDAGRRHELRRYRKSLVGCSPCRAAPERPTNGSAKKNHKAAASEPIHVRDADSSEYVTPDKEEGP